MLTPPRPCRGGFFLLVLFLKRTSRGDCDRIESMKQPALLCDIGNVLVSFDFGLAATRCARFCDQPSHALLSCLDGIKQPYERGDIDDAEFVVRAIEALGFSGTQEEFATIWCEIFEENHAMKASLAGFSSYSERLFLLSNTSGLHKDYLFESYDVFRLFRGGIYSYSAKCAKPERQIFEIAIQQFDLHPEATLYVDDLEANLVTAKELGFQTHLYCLNNHSAFEVALDEWKVSVGLSS